MAFDPDAYLAGEAESQQPFDPDQYLSVAPTEALPDVMAEPVPVASYADVPTQAIPLDDADIQAVERTVSNVINLPIEAAAAINRGAARVVDFLTADQINAALQLAGSEKRVPTFEQALSPATAGGFMPEGLPRDVVRSGGEMVAPAVTGGGLLRQAAAAVPKTVSGIGTTTQEVIKQAGKTLPQQDVSLGALSGAGEAVGQEAGGDVGGLIGAIAAPIAAGAPKILSANAKAVKSALENLKNLKSPYVSSAQSETKQKIGQLIAEGVGDNITAKYMLDGAGKVKADPIAREAIKQGYDEGLVAAMKGGTKIDRAKADKMMDVQERSLKNRRFAMLNRPTDIVGESVLDRFNIVRDMNKAAGKQIDREASKLAGKPVDLDGAVGGLIDDLSKMGITVDESLSPSFRGSTVEGVEGAERVIKNVLKRVANRDLDALQAHRVKRFIDNQVTYGKAGEGVKGEAEQVLKRFRSNVDGALDQNFKGYAKANEKYADTIGALDDFMSSAGYKFDPSSSNASKFVGTLARGLMSNNRGRVQTLDSINALQDVASKYGIKLKDDVVTQAMFADELATVFGSPARTSLAGEVEKGARQAGAVMLGRGFGDFAVESAAEIAKKAQGINEENAVKVMRKLLKRN